jgi:hypothetical protein
MDTKDPVYVTSYNITFSKYSKNMWLNYTELYI